MEELKKFQSSTFDTIARIRSVEDQDIILELTDKIQELQNEINCKNASRDFKDAESVRSGQSHVTVTSVFPTLSTSWWNAKSFSGNAEPQRWASKSLGRMKNRETCLQIQLRSLQHLIRRNLIHGVLMR